VESILYEHPAVAEVAVIGLPDEKWGEAVVAVVAVGPGVELTLEQVREHAARRVARYKLPSRLELVETVPRNASGKLDKIRIRTMVEVD